MQPTPYFRLTLSFEHHIVHLTGLLCESLWILLFLGTIYTIGLRFFRSPQKFQTLLVRRILGRI